MKHSWSGTEMGNQSTRRKNCPIAALSITYPTCTDLELKLSLRDKRPATNRLSHDIALYMNCYSCIIVGFSSVAE
jgi:hypothetical protein